MKRVGQSYRSQCRPGAGAGPNSATEVPEPECDRPTELSHLLGQIRVTQRKRKEGGTAGRRAGGEGREAGGKQGGGPTKGRPPRGGRGGTSVRRARDVVLGMVENYIEAVERLQLVNEGATTA
jgi:hypothetical protein